MILSSPKCRRKLFRVDVRSKDQEINAVDFKPLKNDIRQPVDGDEMLCPLCGATLASKTGERIGDDEMSPNNKVIIRSCGKNWEDVTNETVSVPTYTLYEIISTNGEPERIATNR